MAAHATNSQANKEAPAEELDNAEIIRSISDDDPSMKDRKVALAKNKDKEARKCASTTIKKVKMTGGSGSISCSDSQLKALPNLSDREIVKKKLQVDEILTTSNNSVRHTDVDEGTAKQPILSSQSSESSRNESQKSSKEMIEHLTEECRKLKETDETQKVDINKRNEELKKKGQEICDLRQKLKAAINSGSKIDDDTKKKDKELESKQKMVDDFEGKLARKTVENNDLLNKNKELTKQLNGIKTRLDKANEANTHTKRKFEELKEKHETDIRNKNKQLKDIAVERDHFRDRFMKVAGAKLTDQNADIADLKDPNRALKLSEKFGELYNNEWTDAFTALKRKKVPKREAICLLLRILNDCLKFCNTQKHAQMDILKNVLLHPVQDVSQFVSEPRTHVGGLKDKPKFSADDEKATRTLRRQIAVRDSVIEEIRQIISVEIKSWDQQGYDKKYLEICLPYVQKCTEICWLMVLHDPPLHIKLDGKTGDNLDSKFYTIYASPGDKIDFVVWPPLLNEEGGGLLKTGVAQPLTEPGTS